jgi:hypothetical protein
LPVESTAASRSSSASPGAKRAGEWNEITTLPSSTASMISSVTTLPSFGGGEGWVRAGRPPPGRGAKYRSARAVASSAVVSPATTSEALLGT